MWVRKMCMVLKIGRMVMLMVNIGLLVILQGLFIGKWWFMFMKEVIKMVQIIFMIREFEFFMKVLVGVQLNFRKVI